MLPHCFFRRMASITPSHRHQAVSGRYQNVSVNAKKKSFTKSETLGSFRSVHSSSKTAAAEKSEPYKTETVSKRRANSMYRIPRNKEKTTTIFARFDHPLLLPRRRPTAPSLIQLLQQPAQPRLKFKPFERLCHIFVRPSVQSMGNIPLILARR